MTSVTVFIPTWNGATYLSAVLDAVRVQDFDGGVEILVIDSGSSDGTLEILARYPEVRLHHIPKEEFGHGVTRNLAASLASGTFIAFLTQDAIPHGRDWLRNLVAPLQEFDDVWGVYGRQIPRPNCPPLLKYEIQGTFAMAGVNRGVTLQKNGWFDESERAAASFYSDVNSATRRATLLGILPYQAVRYGEDQLFGRDILAAGKMKAYAPRAAVIHSNDIGVRDFAFRIYDEAVALREMGSPVRPGPLPVVVARILRGVVGDSLRIARDPDYGLGAKVRWWLCNPLFHVQKWRGYRWAAKASLTEDVSSSARSLEARRAKRTG